MTDSADGKGNLSAQVDRWVAAGEQYEAEFKGELHGRLNDRDLVEAVVCLGLDQFVRRLRQRVGKVCLAPGWMLGDGLDRRRRGSGPGIYEDAGNQLDSCAPTRLGAGSGRLPERETIAYKGPGRDQQSLGQVGSIWREQSAHLDCTLRAVGSVSKRNIVKVIDASENAMKGIVATCEHTGKRAGKRW